MLVLVLVLLLPFNAGKLNTRLRPTLPAVRGTDRDFAVDTVPSSLHHKTPTHGCTFQPTTSVTFPRSAMRPEISVMGYFGFWLRRRSLADTSFPVFTFLLREDRLVLVVSGRNRSLSFAKEYGDSGAGMMVSQITA